MSYDLNAVDELLVIENRNQRRARAGAFVLGATSLLIAVVVGIFTIDMLMGMSKSVCYEEYEYLHELHHYENALIWIAVGVWSAFGSICLITYTPTRIWRTTTSVSAGGLIIVGVLIVLLEAARVACQ